ncbi:MAG: serine/threonine protein kinase [Myxococcales bacterium]|nr:serine/threonine protein kinase [Myxococcales bacterium]
MTPYGPYQLVRRLAVGGMAEVFLARWVDPPAGEAAKRLVVKRILPHLEDRQQFVRMFLDEARLTAQLFHPNVVQIHDFGKADGVHYIAMEYIDGLSLRQLLRETPSDPLPLSLSCLVVSDACAGLAYAHGKTGVGGEPLGIVHRDVSPDNILLSRAGEVKLADFGIAKASIHLSRTRPGQIKGKLAYMSPEQALRGQIDHRSDIFALGAVLFECSTGRRLFDGPNDAHVLEALLRGDYPDPRELLPEYSPKLAEVVNRALQHRPADRYDTASDMRRALLDLLPSRELATSELSRRIEHAVARSDAERPRGRDGQRTEVARIEGGTVPGVGPAALAAPDTQEDSEENLLLVAPEEAETDKLRRPDVISEVTTRYKPDELLAAAPDADTIEEAPAVSLGEALQAASTSETKPDLIPIKRRASQLSTLEVDRDRDSPRTTTPRPEKRSTPDPLPEVIVSTNTEPRSDLTGPAAPKPRRRPTADIQATRPRQIIDEPLLGEKRDDSDDDETAKRPTVTDEQAAAAKAAVARVDAPATAPPDDGDDEEEAHYDVDHRTDVVDIPELAPARIVPARPVPYLWIAIAVALVASLIAVVAALM